MRKFSIYDELCDLSNMTASSGLMVDNSGYVRLLGRLIVVRLTWLLYKH